MCYHCNLDNFVTRVRSMPWPVLETGIVVCLKERDRSEFLALCIVPKYLYRLALRNDIFCTERFYYCISRYFQEYGQSICNTFNTSILYGCVVSMKVTVVILVPLFLPTLFGKRGIFTRSPFIIGYFPRFVWQLIVLTVIPIVSILSVA